jgi:error-prone DNA polymerase
VVAGQPYASLEDLARRSQLSQAQLEALATAGATLSLAGGTPSANVPGDGRDGTVSVRGNGSASGSVPGDETASGTVLGDGTVSGGGIVAGGDRRRAALWAAGALASAGPGQLEGLAIGADAPPLPEMGATEVVIADLWSTGVSVGLSLTELVRQELARRGVLTAAELSQAGPGRRVAVAGVVTHRQRPETAAGVTFVNLEDETGLVNVICSVGVWRRYRQVAQSASAMVVSGVVESAGGVVNVVAQRLEALQLPASVASRDFC